MKQSLSQQLKNWQKYSADTKMYHFKELPAESGKSKNK